MKGSLLVVAAALLTSLTQVAAAADMNTAGHSSPNAQKALIVLGYMGVNNHDVKNFVTEMDSHVKGGYFNLNEQEVPGGRLSLGYQFSSDTSLPTVGRRHGFELRYTIGESGTKMPLSVTVRQNSAVAGLHFHF